MGPFLFLFCKAVTVNATASDGQTLLHAASYAGNNDLLTWLLNKSNINIDAQDERGWTPLMFFFV